MFGTLRKHSQPLWIAIIILVVISFVIFFTPNYDPFQAGGGAPSANAEAVEHARSQLLLEQVLDQRQRQVMVQMLARAGRMQEALQMAGGDIQQALGLMQSPPVLETASARRMAGNSRFIDLNGDNYNDINSLEHNARIRLRKLTIADGLGIVISDSAVNLERNFMVQNLNGVQEYNPDHYDALLTQLATGGFITEGRTGREQLDQYIRDRLTLQQLTEIMSRSAGFWPDTDMAEELAQNNREYAVQAAFVSLTNHTVSATNHADITKAEGFTNHFNQVANRYQVPVRRTIAYVKLTLADFEADARKAEKFDEEVQKRIELHNTTTNKFTDLNGTALPVNATNLLARAEAELRDTPMGDRIFIAANAAARTQARDFRKALFPPGLPFATTNLWTTARHFKMEVHTATFSNDSSETNLPPSVTSAAFSPALKEGKLLESAVYAPNPTRPEAIYILGLQEIIPLKLRQYTELNEDEKKEVHESFLATETRRAAREAGEQFQAVAQASLKEGAPFALTATNAGLSVVTVPPFALNAAASTNHMDVLKDLVPLNALQNAVFEHEQKQLGKAEDEKENLTAFLEHAGGGVSFNDSIAGYVLHITARMDGPPLEARDLHDFAARVRQSIRAQAGGNDWFAGHLRQLNAEIIITSLEGRRDGLASEIEEVTQNILYKEQILAQHLAAALQQAGLEDNQIDNALKQWPEAKAGTLKNFVRENYFAEPPKNPTAAKVIVPLLSAGLRQRWADLDEPLANLNQLNALRDGGLDRAIAEARQSGK